MECLWHEICWCFSPHAVHPCCYCPPFIALFYTLLLFFKNRAHFCVHEGHGYFKRVKQISLQPGRGLWFFNSCTTSSVAGGLGIQSMYRNCDEASYAISPDLKQPLQMLMACKCNCLGYMQNEHNKFLFPTVIHQQLHLVSDSLQFSKNSLVQFSLLKT